MRLKQDINGEGAPLFTLGIFVKKPSCVFTVYRNEGRDRYVDVRLKIYEIKWMGESTKGTELVYWRARFMLETTTVIHAVMVC